MIQQFFKQVPLPVKFMLIGLVPLLLLIYLSFQLVREQEKKLNLLNGYIERIHQSSDISKLIYELQTERRYSFDFALKGGFKPEMIDQRRKTDSAITVLTNHYSKTLGDFPAYTFLSELNSNRAKIDSSDMDANAVMHFYTTAVFRLNTLNAVSAGNNDYLDPIYKELVSQKILSEMTTYLSIMRINIYNVLYTRKYMVETLVGTLGTHDVYKSYEKEFFQKASPEILSAFKALMDTSALKPTIVYIDTLFKTFKFDSTYNYQQWWDISVAGMEHLRSLQKKILYEVENKIGSVYRKAETARTGTILLVVAMIVLGFAVLIYSIRTITSMLLDLKAAAQKIAAGGTDIQLKKLSNDVIGSLSDSILRIDEANRSLALAADAIGKGEFDVIVNPRSEEDILGNAIVRMKNDLQNFTNEMKELEKRKDNFITMASHELKTPITSVKGYVQLLLNMLNDSNTKSKVFSTALLHSSLVTIDKQVSKLIRLISELLDLSKIETGQFELTLQPFNLNELVAETVRDVQQTTSHHRVSLQNGSEFDINGDRDRIGQVIMNLLTNAIKYSPNSETIEVVIFQNKNNTVSVSVKDFGIGIDWKEQEKIFERFYRAEGDVEQTYPGFGIGLFIVREILQRHNGTISVSSEKDKESTFTFTLPHQ